MAAIPDQVGADGRVVHVVLLVGDAQPLQSHVEVVHVEGSLKQSHASVFANN